MTVRRAPGSTSVQFRGEGGTAEAARSGIYSDVRLPCVQTARQIPKLLKIHRTRLRLSRYDRVILTDIRVNPSLGFEKTIDELPRGCSARTVAARGKFCRPSPHQKREAPPLKQAAESRSPILWTGASVREPAAVSAARLRGAEPVRNRNTFRWSCASCPPLRSNPGSLEDGFSTRPPGWRQVRRPDTPRVCESLLGKST